MAPEVLFKPDFIQNGQSNQGLHQMTVDSIKDCDIDVRKELYQNIILTGGTTMFKGFPERLEKELDDYKDLDMKATISAKINR